MMPDRRSHLFADGNDRADDLGLFSGQNGGVGRRHFGAGRWHDCRAAATCRGVRSAAEQHHDRDGNDQDSAHYWNESDRDPVLVGHRRLPGGVSGRPYQLGRLRASCRRRNPRHRRGLTGRRRLLRRTAGGSLLRFRQQDRRTIAGAVLAESFPSDIGGLRRCSTSVSASGPSGSRDGCIADRLLDSRLGYLIAARPRRTSGDWDTRDFRCRRGGCCGRGRFRGVLALLPAAIAAAVAVVSFPPFVSDFAGWSTSLPAARLFLTAFTPATAALPTK